MALTQISTGGIKDDAVTDAKLPANSVGNSEMKDDAVGVAELSATGTASSSTFLRGDNSWVTPTDTNTQLAFANDANNRVVTGTGSGLNGEANLTFDGTNLGVGVTPSTFSLGNAVQLEGAGVGVWGENTSTLHLFSNAYYNSGYKYGVTAPAGQYQMYQNTHTWSIAASGTAGAALTWVPVMKIDTAGKVGIGTTSPANVLHTVGTTRTNQSSTLGHATNAGTMLEVRGNAIGDGVVDVDFFKGLKIALNDQTEWGGQAQFAVGRWEDNGNNARSSLMISLGHGQSNSATDADTDVMLLTSDGQVEIRDGNLKIGTAGHGIDFSANSHTSGMTSELLDSYEEGSWTPTLPGGGNMGIYNASYTKIGRMVSWWAYIYPQSVPNNNTSFTIGGFPFTSSSTTNMGGSAVCGYSGSLDTTDFGYYKNTGDTNMSCYFTGGGNQGGSIQNQHITGATRYFALSGTYYTA